MTQRMRALAGSQSGAADLSDRADLARSQDLVPFQDRATLRRAPSPAPIACFSVMADADAGTLPRILEVFAKLGLLPSRLYATEEFQPERHLLVDLQVAGIDKTKAGQLAANLQSMVVVRRVLTSERAVAGQI